MRRNNHLTNLGLTGYSLMAEYRFLLVSPNTDVVLEGAVIHQRKRKLDEMTKGNGLRDARSAALVRIKE